MNEGKGKLGGRSRTFEKYVRVKRFIVSMPLIYSYYLVATHAADFYWNYRTANPFLLCLYHDRERHRA